MNTGATAKLLISFITFLSVFNSSYADLKEDLHSLVSMKIFQGFLPFNDKCSEDKTNSENSKYCPYVLNHEVLDSYDGGVWGLVTQSAMDGVDTPIALCIDQSIEKQNGLILPLFTPKDYEKFLASQKFNTHTYSISEMYPYCLEQFTGTPDEIIKKNLMVSNFFMGHIVISDEEENLLKAIAGTDLFLGKSILENIDCLKLQNQKSIDLCEQMKKCDTINETNRDEKTNEMVQNTFIAFNEIKMLKEKISIQSKMSLGVLDSTADEQLKNAIDQKMALYPWLSNKTFNEKLESTYNSGLLTKDKVHVLIKGQLQLSSEELNKKLMQTTALHNCLTGYAPNEICDDYSKKLRGLDSFKLFLNKTVIGEIPDYEISESEKIEFKKRILAGHRLQQSHCVLKTKANRDDTVSDLSAELAVGAALGGATFGVGLFAEATYAGARIVYIAGRPVMALATGAYATKQVLDSYYICQNEFVQLKNFKRSQGKNYCPVLKNSELYRLEENYGHCLSGVATAAALAAVPIISSKILLKVTAGDKKLGHNDLDLSRYFSKDEVNKYQKLDQAEKAFTKANASTGSIKQQYINQGQILKNEVGDVDLERYLLYRKDYLDNDKIKTSFLGANNELSQHANNMQVKDLNFEELSVEDTKSFFNDLRGLTKEDFDKYILSSKTPEDVRKQFEEHSKFLEELKRKNPGQYNMIDFLGE